MFVIDMTAQLAPIGYGLVAAFVASGLALFANAIAPVVTARLQRRARQRLALAARPALAAQAH